MKPAVPRIHAVTNEAVAGLDDLQPRARALARSAAVALHARLPGADGRVLLELAVVLQQVSKRSGTITVVNDRVDIAVVAQVAGVHLPAAGIPVPAARRLVKADLLVGRSAHSADDARRASDEGADYVFLGPIWETSTHPGRAPLGVTALRDLGPIKVIAIGGVTPERARRCRDAGAWGVAAISALWLAPDPRAAVEEMLLSFG